MKIGFACKYHSDDKQEQRRYNFSTTTWRALQQLYDHITRAGQS